MRRRNRAALALLLLAGCATQAPSLPRLAPEEYRASQRCSEHVRHRVAPAYPRDAVRNGQSGYVVMDYELDGSGRVLNVRVYDSSPRGVFDKASVEALQRSTFREGPIDTTCREVDEYHLGGTPTAP
jgi:TonB family protein